MTTAMSITSGRGRDLGLPAEATSFIGRRHEIAEVKRLVSVSRMVTLTGPGGVGKTRLALRVANDLRRAFPEGVWLVELAELDNPALLPQAVVAALRIEDRTAHRPIEALVEHLAGDRMLVILDNCEHLLQETAVLAEALLRRVPELRILATSRQPLGIFSEQMFTVPMLSLPDGGSRPGRPGTSPDAVRLFAERAGAVLPGFAVTERNRDVVERICRRLDGLPLGIELAAVRLRALSLEQLLDRLDDRFGLLSAGSRAVAPRHQTLRALIDWSYALCTEEERLMWARVSVFTGSLDLEAAEEVCSGDGIARDEVVGLAIGLVEKSVLVREEYPSGVRYRLLDTIRQYGRERLAASGQEATMKRRFRDYYRNLSRETKARLFGPAQVELLTRLRVEHPNLRTALEYCHAEHAGLCIDMASDLLYHWITSCHTGEGRDWLEQGLAASGGRSEVRARALWACSWLAIIQGDQGSARTMLAESKALGERLGLEPVLGYVALYSGMVALNQGDGAAAVTCLEEAVARHRAAPDPLGEALALNRLSLAYSFLGDSNRAIAAAEESLSVCDAHEERWHKAYTMAALGIEAWRQGDTRRAATLERESLRFNRSLDDSLGAGLSLEVLAWIAGTEHEYTRAGEMLGILRTVWEAVGAPLPGYSHLARYHDECEARTLQALGESALRAAVDRGGSLSYDEALAYALEERRPTPGRSGGADRWSPLTRRETEIARLVAQGMSNKEIAASLVIAQRTAEGHIEHILRKLDFSSRAQIATWVTEQAPTGD
ncbi:LuxR C-terminal-related transcriptional regulator [Actinoallomurus purpureus]|uniref:ATP-binding protein n=1 Tax=Actinoallomurus purpureus TaxID=478114 RepID=UPI002093F110|nr:LuxR C-terminal-related transcriptional regulator [Actinoallomurus purpureus]MCO6003860.1 LuxR C-terminal-related transcriptional regulator [Actinoallomurus purpureus]